jgi:class 3 adenylate cyclase
MVTVMFTDFKGFTEVSEKVSAELLVSELDYCFSAFDNIIHEYKIEKIKTIGDSYMCTSGMPVLNYSHAIDMVRASIEIQAFMDNRKMEKESKGDFWVDISIGIHTGPVVAGIVGVKKYSYDIWVIL